MTDKPSVEAAKRVADEWFGDKESPLAKATLVDAILQHFANFVPLADLKAEVARHNSTHRLLREVVVQLTGQRKTATERVREVEGLLHEVLGMPYVLQKKITGHRADVTGSWIGRVRAALSPQPEGAGVPISALGEAPRTATSAQIAAARRIVKEEK
jgi:hypothetical protein